MPAAQTIDAMTLQRQQAMGAHLAKKTPARVLAFMTALRAKFSFFPTSEVLMTRAPWDLQAGGQQRVRLEGVEAGAPHLVCLHPADNARSGYRKQEREGEANPRAEANQGLVGTKTQARHESAAPYASALAHLHHRMHSMIFDVRPQPVESSALQARMRAFQATPATPRLLLPACGSGISSGAGEFPSSPRQQKQRVAPGEHGCLPPGSANAFQPACLPAGSPPGCLPLRPCSRTHRADDTSHVCAVEVVIVVAPLPLCRHWDQVGR